MRRALSLLVASVALAAGACGESASESQTDPTPCGGPTPEERAANQKVFDALSPTCAGCHSTGSRGFFASIEAFEALVVYAQNEVVPGDPDNSELVLLLEGHGTRAFTQMPIAGPAYADMADIPMSMADIRAWVVGLEARQLDPLPSIEARRVTRMAADDIQRALYQQLGLTDEDFFVPANNYDIEHKSNQQSDERYALSSPEAIPAPFESLPVERFASLGGGSAMFQMKSDSTVTPSYLGTLSQVSQRWCAMALDKANNTALLPAGASVATGSSDPAAVKAVIRQWFLHFHATVADDASVNEVFDTVFVPLETETDARAGYIGTCSYFIRHPHWVFY